MIIAGDFNIDWSNNGFYKQKLESIFNDYGVKQIVDICTRVTPNTRTIIDYIITNRQKVSVQINHKNKISDHETININIQTKYTTNNKVQYKEIEKFKYEKNAFSRELYSRLNAYENDNQNVKLFDLSIEGAIQKFTKKIKVREHNNIPWFTRDLMLLKQQKISSYRIATLENTNEAWNNYKKIRNVYKNKIVSKKNLYVKNKIENAKNQKEMWREIKDLVLRKNRPMIQSVMFNQIEYKDSYQIASQFNNKFFVDSVSGIRDSIQNVQYINHVPATNSKFRFKEISVSELKEVCKNMKNKPDFNKVTIKIILDNWNLVGGAILRIVNESLKTGIFPDTWKETMVTPVEKIKSTRKCEEYRPINTLKTCEKIIEKVVKMQLENYMERNGLFSKYQSGFRKNFSCETAVNYIINRWKKIERSNKILAIFLDFKRAFETIDRGILVQKLYLYGVRDMELKWFESYLTNRRQVTKVNGVKSNAINNDFGVPQGSILGALLFIIYINDMPNIIEKSEIVLYADDTLIFSEAENNTQCHENVVHDLSKIDQWLKMNKLKLNENKTKAMEINMNSELVTKINNTEIEKVEKIKYLGFVIDKNLKFNEHIEFICKKIGKKIGFFKRLRPKVSTLTAINIYNVIIKPHFEYGSTILFSCCTNTQIERLQKMQNRAMRVILRCNRYTSVQFMLDTLKWLNIQQRLKLNTIYFIKKMKMGNAPQYLCEQLEYVGEIQSYYLRNSNNFRIQWVSTAAGQRTLFYKGLKLYNMLPNDVKNERNKCVFNRKIVNFIKNDLITI